MERSTEACVEKRTGAPGSHQRTWDDIDFFPLLFPGQVTKALEGLPPDFLWSLVELGDFMRLSLQKAAHANMGDAAYRKSGSPHLLRPTYAGANVGHPSARRRSAS